METNLIKESIYRFKNKYPILKDKSDDWVFSVVCLNYYFFNESDNQIDVETISRENITDGKSDGGFDAVINDGTSETGDMIIVQSKYWETPVKQDLIVGEISKIAETLDKLNSKQDSSINQKVKHAFTVAKEDMEDDAKTRVIFFTSFVLPENRKKEKKNIEKKVNKIFSQFNISVELYWGDDVEAQIRLYEEQKKFVEKDKLLLDMPDNCLKYKNSAVVNVSAESLHTLYQKRENGLLGANLRYFIPKKQVDSKIQKTIANDSENFWYKNNGILIICEDFEISGKELHLTNFSIVNGGQTTRLIGDSDITNDFYLQCKVVKIDKDILINVDTDKKDDFINEIAVASNSQKSISAKDLKSNSTEQAKLKELLFQHNIYYKIKAGDTMTGIKKDKFSKYEITNPDKVGKVVLAGLLQKPAESRNNSKMIFNDDQTYYRIFKDFAPNYPKSVKDLLKIDFLYEKYRKKSDILESFDVNTTQPAIRNGRTFFLAIIVLLAKLSNDYISKKDINTMKKGENNLDTLLKYLQTTPNNFEIIVNKYDDEEERLTSLFATIGKRIIGPCYAIAHKIAEKEGNTLDASRYLKDKNVYINDIVPKVIEEYYGNDNKDFKNAIDSLVKNDN